jgi:hypothetical protein
MFFDQDPLIIPISDPAALTYSSVFPLAGNAASNAAFAAGDVVEGDLLFVCADMGQSDHSDDGGAGWQRSTETVVYSDSTTYRVRLYYRVATAGDASSGITLAITNNAAETRPAWAGVARKAVGTFDDIVASESSESTLEAPSTGNVFTENGITLFAWASKDSAGVSYLGAVSNGAIFTGSYNDGAGDMTAFAYKAIVGGSSGAVTIEGSLAGQQNIAATFGLQ